MIDDLLSDWRQANPEHTADLRVVGHRWSDRSREIKMFLARNHVPYRWFDIERDAEGRRLTGLAQANPADLPLVLVPDGGTLRSPSTAISRTRSACGRPRGSRCTTSASSGVARRVWRPECMRHPKG